LRTVAKPVAAVPVVSPPLDPASPAPIVPPLPGPTFPPPPAAPLSPAWPDPAEPGVVAAGWPEPHAVIAPARQTLAPKKMGLFMGKNPNYVPGVVGLRFPRPGRAITFRNPPRAPLIRGNATFVK
jgi:hypothetical protein